MRKRALNVAAVGVAMFMTTGGVADAAKKYSNCTKLNRDYATVSASPALRQDHGGTPVTNFKRSRALYNANKGSDRDGDGIACEKA